MIGLDIHSVEKIKTKRTVFETFVVIDFVLTQKVGTKVKLQAFANRDDVEIEYEPEEVVQPFAKESHAANS